MRQLGEMGLALDPIQALEDVAWWRQDQLLLRGLGSSFDMPSVYVTGPSGVEAVSSQRMSQTQSSAST